MPERLHILIVDIEGEQERYARLVRERFPDLVEAGRLRVTAVQREEDIPPDVEDVQIVGTEPPLVNTVGRLPHLRWVMTFTAGYDHHLKANWLPPHVPLVNAAGCAAQPISEHVLMVMLMLVKRMPNFARLQAEARFERLQVSELGDKTLGIIGLGAIGRETARKAKCFGMRVIGTKRTVTELPHVDEVLPAPEYGRVLQESDFVLLAATENESTTGLIGAAELAAMKPTAFLINVARASMVDHDALVEALRARRIAGAALDVFWERRPLPSFLPPGDPLWGLDNVIITPHVSFQTDYFVPRACAIFNENIARFLAGQALVNVVPR